MESRKLLPNASYFAFTATPKNKTLEIFGEPDPHPDSAVRHRAFHSYTMKQAIQEGFILDVLAHYTPVASYYRCASTRILAVWPQFVCFPVRPQFVCPEGGNCFIVPHVSWCSGKLTDCQLALLRASRSTNRVATVFPSRASLKWPARCP